MSKLYGYLDGDRGQAATKASSNVIEARVQTQKGRVTVSLNQHGQYTVTESRSGGSYQTGYAGSREVASGNVDRDSGQHRFRLFDRTASRAARRAGRR